jgi:hypothetical protein
MLTDISSWNIIRYFKNTDSSHRKGRVTWHSDKIFFGSTVQCHYVACDYYQLYNQMIWITYLKITSPKLHLY